MIKIIAQDILKTKNIIRGTADLTLNKALAKLTRSHEAMFVFDNKSKFVGIISPYHVIFKSTYPPETKLENCLYKPPKITSDTSIWDIAKLMVESKVYYLPVLSKNSFTGIVTVNRLLKSVAHSNEMKPIQIKTSSRLITINKSASISNAYQLMKDKHVSRLPVINDTERLIGIITRYDIQKAFSKPKHKPRFLSRSGDKVAKLKQPLTKYYQKMALSLPQNTTGNIIVESIIERDVGSVILVDKNRKPVAIVSIHDILSAISMSRPGGGANVIIDCPNDFIHKTQFEQLISKYLKKFTKRYKIQRLSTRVELKKNPAGKIKEYTISMEASNNQRKWVSKDRSFKWKDAAHKALDKIDHQLRKVHY